MNRRLLFIVVTFIALRGLGQKKTDTLHLYFAINEIESQHNLSRLDSAVKALNKNVDIGIYGYADFLSNDAYNFSLSQKRAEAVKRHLLSKKSAYINVYACEGKGESNSKDNSTAEGEPTQRRVDVYFEPVITFNVAESYLETPKETPKEASKKEIEPKPTNKKTLRNWKKVNLCRLKAWVLCLADI